MKVSVTNSQGLLHSRESHRLRERVYFSLLKFGSRVEKAKVFIARESDTRKFYCSIDVELSTGRFVSVTASDARMSASINSAVEAIENKVAFRVDWQAWVNADKFSTWVATRRRALNGVLRFER